MCLVVIWGKMSIFSGNCRNLRYILLCHINSTLSAGRIAEKQPILAYQKLKACFLKYSFSVLLLQKNSPDKLRLYMQRGFDLVALGFLWRLLKILTVWRRNTVWCCLSVHYISALSVCNLPWRTDNFTYKYLVLVRLFFVFLLLNVCLKC